MHATDLLGYSNVGFGIMEYLNSSKKMPHSSSKGFDRKYLADVAKKLFEENRDTIVDNVSLKCHNVFLVVMFVFSAFWNDEIQAKRPLRRNS